MKFRINIIEERKEINTTMYVIEKKYCLLFWKIVRRSPDLNEIIKEFNKIKIINIANLNNNSLDGYQPISLDTYNPPPQAE